MRRRILAAATALTVLAAPAAAQAAKHYRAEVRRTTGGWAHIKAAGYGSLGYGYGYAYAQDQLCEMADIVTTVNAQRSRWFGPPGRQPRVRLLLPAHPRPADGRAPRAPEGAAWPVEDRAPDRPRASPRATTRTCARPGRDKLSDPTCRGKGWVRPITALDLYRRFYQLGLRASSGNFSDEIVAAAPPAARRDRGRRLQAGPRTRSTSASAPSHAWAPTPTASAATARAASARCVLGNPHFPWQGSERFYEVHLTIPGKLNVIGAALQGVPIVNIGFNEHVAWSHTVSTARRFTPYELKLVPGKPTDVHGRRQGHEDGRAHGAGAREAAAAGATRSTRRAGGRCSSSPTRA